MGGKTGLKLNYFAYSELPAASNRRSMWQDSPMRLLTTANFAILPSSLHRRSYRITLDPMGSETKRMVFSLNVGMRHFHIDSTTKSGNQLMKCYNSSMKHRCCR